MREMVSMLMRKLRLGAMAREWENVTFESPVQYLHDLLTWEVKEREANKINKLIKAADFPSRKTLDEFEWHSGIALPGGLTRESLEKLRFLETHDNVIFLGSIGTGKTHLAQALGLQACQEGYAVRFFTAAGLANMLLKKHDDGQLAAYMQTLGKADLIILDEVGYIPLHKTAAELFFQVTAECYERKSLIVTSNLEFSRWNTVLGDTQLTTALIDRLIHHAHIVLFTGDSYRLTQSVARQAAAGAEAVSGMNGPAAADVAATGMKPAAGSTKAGFGVPFPVFTGSDTVSEVSVKASAGVHPVSADVSPGSAAATSRVL